MSSKKTCLFWIASHCKITCRNRLHLTLNISSYSLPSSPSRIFFIYSPFLHEKIKPKTKNFCLHWLTLILLQLSAFGAELSSEACRELGFSSNLLCNSCDLLGEFSLTKLQPDCRQCCQQEAQMGARKVKGVTELRELAKRTSLSV